ncbi:hypothetical protein [Nocardioides alcanivorans]|uniref:hypothetical protein n=1 Tax=Nocardioides alcanivorans TaxID=2897352 RepID=UPI001F1577A0|nr:hypothetical protein [Nocardioides alcanivorans]
MCDAMHFDRLHPGQPPQTGEETGPLLTTMLRQSGYVFDDVAWVACVAASDGYVAVVTPAERLADKFLQIAVSETADGVPTTSTPRLVVGGDVTVGAMSRGSPIW